jgi:hypothetical protein
MTASPVRNVSHHIVTAHLQPSRDAKTNYQLTKKARVGELTGRRFVHRSCVRSPHGAWVLHDKPVAATLDFVGQTGAARLGDVVHRLCLVHPLRCIVPDAKARCAKIVQPRANDRADLKVGLHRQPAMSKYPNYAGMGAPEGPETNALATHDPRHARKFVWWRRGCRCQTSWQLQWGRSRAFRQTGRVLRSYSSPQGRTGSGSHPPKSSQRPSERQ